MPYKRNEVSENSAWKFLKAQSDYNIAFGAKTVAIYAIDKQGKYTKFPSVLQAVTDLNMDYSNVLKCLQGKALTSKGYYFIYANEIETVDNEGNGSIDEDKLNKKINKIKAKEEEINVPVYAIDADGEYKRFSSMTEAAKKTGTDISTISKCTRGLRNYAANNIYILAQQVEDTDEKGIVTINQEKMEQVKMSAVNTLSKDPASNPFYAIDKEGNCEKFFRLVNASDKLNVSSANISRCLSSRGVSTGGYYFIQASKIESTDSKGHSYIDKDKLKKELDMLIGRAYLRDDRPPVYSIDREGNYRRHANFITAGKELNIANAFNIGKCLNGEQKTAGGYFFVFASDVEKKDKDGNLSVDRRKMNFKIKKAMKIFSEAKTSKPFYAINKEGNHTRFERVTDAEKALGVCRSHIIACLKGRAKTAGGYAFVYVDQVERYDENNNVVVEINIPEEQFKKLVPIPVYALDDKGNLRKFSSINEASSALSVGDRNIAACISGFRLSDSGYAFMAAEDIELKNVNGKIELNEDIIAEKFQGLIKYAVYVISPKGIVKRYKTKAEAANALKVANQTVISASNGIHEMSCGSKVVNASYLESYKDGKVVVNKELLSRIAKQTSENNPLRPVIVTDKDGNRKKFPNKVKAAKELNMTQKYITACLRGDKATYRGYRFEFEEAKTPKRKYIKKNSPFKIYATYGFTETSYEFPDIETAAKEIGVTVKEIEYFLTNNKTEDGRNTIRGYVLATDQDE